MKRMSCMAFCIFSFMAVYAQTAQSSLPPVQSQPADVLELVMTEYDFGKIPQNKPVYYSFEIINKGKTPIKLDNVIATCGCTTPEWNREAIAPGASDKIKVGYNA
ncbi:MAG: DUF1573 domain-containing protein, partial [Flavisolibacter sp.]